MTECIVSYSNYGLPTGHHSTSVHSWLSPFSISSFPLSSSSPSPPPRSTPPPPSSGHNCSQTRRKMTPPPPTLRSQSPSLYPKPNLAPISFWSMILGTLMGTRRFLQITPHPRIARPRNSPRLSLNGLPRVKAGNLTGFLGFGLVGLRF